MHARAGKSLCFFQDPFLLPAIADRSLDEKPNTAGIFVERRGGLSQTPKFTCIRQNSTVPILIRDLIK